jgi:putative Mg2+ transporter-C (MgtC) family protein
MEPDIADIALRLAAASLVGVLLGLNRDLTGKPIGMRTLALVSLGAAVVSLSTINFHNFEEHPDALSRYKESFKGSWAASASSAQA